MILAIVSALGISGIGATLWFIPGLLPAAVALLRTIPPLWLVVAALSVSTGVLWHNADGWKAKAETCAAGRASDMKAVRDGVAASVKLATDEKIRHEAADVQIAKDKSDEIAQAHVDARSAVDRWVRAHPVARNIGQTDLPKAADTTVGPVAADTPTVVPASDLQTCADNTVIAEGWQDWYAAVSATHVDK